MWKISPAFWTTVRWSPVPTGSAYYAWAKLIHSGKIRKYIGSHVGSNPDAGERWAQGELELDLLPQGSLAEMIRAGGMGIPGILTPTGVGTLVENSPWVDRKLEIDGRDYLLMKPLRADFALISGYRVDTRGNVWYKGTTRNFAPLMAMAADTVIVEAEHLVQPGDIPPEDVVTPGILERLHRSKGGRDPWIRNVPKTLLQAAAPGNSGMAMW